MALSIGEHEKHRLQVSCLPPPLSPTQRKFKSFLLSLENSLWMRIGGCLIRFWTPVLSRSKQKRLSISKQPFRVGRVCDGVCRFRYHCIQYANSSEDSYSSEEIPLQYYTKIRGFHFQGTLALPIFEQRNHRHRKKKWSSGVLEILTFTENISLDAILEKLKSVSLAIRCSPPCRKLEGCRGRFDKRLVGLNPLRDLSKLPLIQKWLHRHAYFVEDCKRLVGRTHSENQICLAEDIRNFLDCPLSPLAHPSKPAKRRRGDQVQSRELGYQTEDHKLETVLKDNVQHYRIRNGQCGEESSKATKRLKGDQVQNHEQQPSSETTYDKENPQGATDASKEPSSNTRKRNITLAMIENYFDRRLKDAAAELKVSKSTLKRYCRKYDIKSWPSPKRKKTNHVLRPSNELGDYGGKVQECDSRPPSPDHSSSGKQVIDANRSGKHDLDLNHSFIVKARYNGCLVKFPFSTNSGIDTLHKSLAMRFRLEVEMIRIEYEDEDGDRVMISCDEDLSYHMHTLSSSGRTRMDLSVLPAV